MDFMFLYEKRKVYFTIIQLIDKLFFRYTDKRALFSKRVGTNQWVEDLENMGIPNARLNSPCRKYVFTVGGGTGNGGGLDFAGQSLFQYRLL